MSSARVFCVVRPFIFVLTAVMALFFLAGCPRFLFEGEQGPLNPKMIKVTLPADTIPPAVKPLPQTDVTASTRDGASQYSAPAVDKSLLPQTPPSSDPLRIIPLEPSRPISAHALDQNGLTSQPEVINGVLFYRNQTITEDTTWRGSILITEGLTVAPQATLRIEPGAVVRFSKREGSQHLPRLVVMGRIQCSGLPEKPVLLTSEPAGGEWGGILLLGSEKKNLFEHTRIAGARAGIEARHSSMTLKGVRFERAQTGIIMHDSMITASGVSVERSDTGLVIHDSEAELKEGSFSTAVNGIIATRSSLTLTGIAIQGNSQNGISSDECRLRLKSVVLENNTRGTFIRGGEGFVQLSRFSNNREAGMVLAGSRVRVVNSSFNNNDRDGLRVEGGGGSVWWCGLFDNGAYNLHNAGHEDFSAVQNWWGTGDETGIGSKIFDSVKDTRSGAVQITPWLTSKPAYLP